MQLLRSIVKGTVNLGLIVFAGFIIHKLYRWRYGDELNSVEKFIVQAFSDAMNGDFEGLGTVILTTAILSPFIILFWGVNTSWNRYSQDKILMPLITRGMWNNKSVQPKEQTNGPDVLKIMAAENVERRNERKNKENFLLKKYREKQLIRHDAEVKDNKEQEARRSDSSDRET